MPQKFHIVMGKEFDKALVAHSISNAVKYRTSRQNSVY